MGGGTATTATIGINPANSYTVTLGKISKIVSETNLETEMKDRKKIEKTSNLDQIYLEGKTK